MIIAVERSQTEVPAGIEEIAFEAFGVRVAVGADPPALLGRVRELLPPGWSPCASADVERRFAIVGQEVGTYACSKDGEVFYRGLELELALSMLDSQIRMTLGVRAPEVIFVHAGAVGHNGKAIVLPGSSFAGKTTLVAALIRAGALYLSDEFAVIDRDGLVHPYAKPLSIRGADQWQTDHPVSSFGAASGTEPLPLGAVVVTRFRAGADWEPRRLSQGAGAMALVAHAVPARKRPEQVMQTMSRAVNDVLALESDRGEADEVAQRILAEVERPAA